jgi:hypothetical protein
MMKYTQKCRAACRRLAVATMLLALMPACDSYDPFAITSGALLNFAGQRRGSIRLGFINNSSARAVFTFGGYDPLDENTAPTIGQLRLEANSSSAQLTQPCRRVFSIGGQELVRLVQVRGLTQPDPAALVDGVNFSTAPANDPLATLPTEGTSRPVTVEVGRDFECDGLLLFTFSEDVGQPGGFRIDYRFFPLDDE